MRRTIYLIFFSFFILHVHVPSARGESETAQSEEDKEEDKKEEAKKQFKKGVSLFDKGNYKSALKKFNLSFEIDPHYRIRFYKGMCHFKLKNYVDAIVELLIFIDEAGEDAPEKQVERAQDTIKFAREKVMTIKLSDVNEDIEVIVDDEIPRYSPDGKEVFLAPGSYNIKVTSGGEILLDENMSGTQGEVQMFKIYLKDKEIVKEKPETSIEKVPVEPAGKKVKKSEKAPMTGNDKLKAAGWAAASVAALSLVAGGVAGGLAIKEKKKVDDLQKEYDSKVGVAAESELREIEKNAWDHYDKGKALARSSTVLFIVGGGMAAASVTLLTTGFVFEKRSSPEPEVNLSASPFGLFVTAHF